MFHGHLTSKYRFSVLRILDNLLPTETETTQWTWTADLTWNRPQGQGAQNDLLSPRHVLQIGIWKRRTLYETRKAVQVAREFDWYHLDILGLSEVRWEQKATLPEQHWNGALKDNAGEVTPTTPGSERWTQNWKWEGWHGERPSGKHRTITGHRSV